MYAIEYRTFGTVYLGESRFASYDDALAELRWCYSCGYVEWARVVEVPATAAVMKAKGE